MAFVDQNGEEVDEAAMGEKSGTYEYDRDVEHVRFSALCDVVRVRRTEGLV